VRSQAEAILACDFFTADLLSGTQAYVLAVIEHASRRIDILGVALHPTGVWTAQQHRIKDSFLHQVLLAFRTHLGTHTVF
jgi:putative transposase